MASFCLVALIGHAPSRRANQGASPCDDSPYIFVSVVRPTATSPDRLRVPAGPVPRTMAQSVLDTMAGAATGTVLITDPLNFWGGKRVKPRQEKHAEPVFEPATGKNWSPVRYVLLHTSRD